MMPNMWHGKALEKSSSGSQLLEDGEQSSDPSALAGGGKERVDGCCLACSLSGNRGRSLGEYRCNGKERRDEGVQEEKSSLA